jgi:hypothetical protein
MQRHLPADTIVELILNLKTNKMAQIKPHINFNGNAEGKQRTAHRQVYESGICTATTSGQN